MTAAYQCCGISGEPSRAGDGGVGGFVAGASPGAVAWDGMRDWYVEHMSPATANLASTLFRHAGLLDGVEEGSQKRVLETHCGDARAAAALLPSSAIQAYTACDFSPKMLEAASTLLGSRAATQLADSTALPFTDGAFDCYISNMGGCCVADLDAMLQEVRRVLVPGGVASMSMRIEGLEGDTAFHLAQSTLAKFGMPPGPDREGLRLGKDLPALRRKLADCGFKDVKAWRTWVTIPLSDGSADAYMKWATCVGPVKKFLGTLSEEQAGEALSALREASLSGPQQDGAVHVAAAVFVVSV